MNEENWDALNKHLTEENIQLLKREGYRELIAASHNMEAMLNSLMLVFTKEGVEPGNIAILRALSPPSGKPSLVQILDARGEYAHNKGDIFDSEKSLCGLAIDTNQPQYAPLVAAHPRVILPENIHGNASEYAYPIKYDSEEQSFHGALLLRREIADTNVDMFPQADRDKISDILLRLKTSIAMRLGINETKYDPKCRTISSAMHLPVALGRDYEEAKRHWSSYAVAFIDLDDFKSLNSTYGHVMTDDILYVVGEVLREGVRENDIVGRHGGDEFVIGMRGVDASTLESRISSIRQRMHDIGDRLLSKRIGIPRGLSLNFSAGAAIYERPREPQAKLPSPTIYQLLDTADDAVYRAKEQGKNRTVITPMIVF